MTDETKKLTTGKRKAAERKPFKVLKKRKTEDGKTKLVRPGAPGFETKAVKEVATPDQRIAKHLARVGIGSRREIERMIGEGRVVLNGKVLDTPATLVGPNDKIEVDGEAVGARERTRLWLYHKPDGLVTTNKDPEGRSTVFEKLPVDMPRVMSVGRLDIATEGLLLLTNDGGLARQLELPSTGWLRRYRVRAHGEVNEEALADLQNGIAVDGVLYGPIEATIDRKQGSNTWLMLGLREGKNREVRNVLGALGLEVNRLIRVSYGPFQLGEMNAGEAREIRGRTLRDQLGNKLIEASGADFESELRESASSSERDGPKGRSFGGKPRNSSGDGRGRPERSDRGEYRKREDKTPRGRMRQETEDRLDTRRQGGDDRKPRAGGRPFGDGKGRPDGDKRSSWKRDGDGKSGERKFGDRKPSDRNSSGSRAPSRSDSKPGDGGRPRSGGKPSGGRPGSSRPGHGRPGGGRPGSGRPGGGGPGKKD